MKGRGVQCFTAVRTGALICIAMLFCGEASAQQRVQFTQYMFNGLIINPAYAGAHEALSLTFIQRSQWAGVENAPNTQTLSAHTLFKKKHLGLGVSLINDRIGVHKNISALTNYAYHLRVSSNAYLSMGLLAGIHSRKSDFRLCFTCRNNKQ
jgi:type IX secretion system PorP/SprF family membrane protein